MWNQENRVCWRGVVGLICAMMGLGCISSGYYDPSVDGVYARAESAALPGAFSLPLVRDEQGRIVVTAGTPVVSDEQWISRTKSFTGSFNAEVPQESTLYLEIRIRFDELVDQDVVREWSPWVRIAWAGKLPSTKQGSIDARLGSVNIDELMVKMEVYRLQVRLRLESNDPNAVARVSRIDVPTANKWGRDDSHHTVGKPTPIDIPVPFRSQNTPDSSLNDKLCSPTSVAMVLAYYGVDATVEEVAKKCYDPEYGIYGNWPRNIQAAYEFGVPGSLVRMQSWWEVGKILETGQPLIISIRAERGELRGAPYDATEGHLIVLRGIDEFGNLIVNDPACGTAEDGKRVYRRSDLTKVWLQATDGTAYLLGTPELVQKARYQWNKVRNNPSDTSGGER